MRHAGQPGVFREGFRHFHALELRLHDGVSRGAMLNALRAAHCADSDELVTVVAFGPSCLAHMDDESPAFEPLKAIHGRDGFVMPATPRDILYWLQGRDEDVLFDAITRIAEAFRGVASIELDLAGFTYRDSRDLTGFIDGTANPKGVAARNAALVAEGQPGEGGSFVLTQRWNHDLAAFRQLPVAEQELIIGRTKVDSIELDEAHMPRSSHVARTDVKIDGEAMNIWRRSMPFGNAREHGLYFLAFSCRLARFDVQLRRMAGDWEDGVRDRLTDFSTPVSGAYWFAPSAAKLSGWTGR